MNSIKLIVLLALVVLLCGSASAFDGRRQGFVLGGGLGGTVYSRISPEIEGHGERGLALHGLIGYAQNEHNLIAFEGNFTTRLFVGNGFYGPTWYRYFGDRGKAFFSVVGLGVYYYSADLLFHEPEDHETGLGYMIGGGYEFTGHVQVGAYFCGGSTEFNNVDYTHNHFNLVITFTAF